MSNKLIARKVARNDEITSLKKRGYVIGRLIGQGSYATVHIADYDCGSQKATLACKIFDKRRAPKDFLDKFFPRELEMLTKINNSHIIQMHSVLQRGPKVFIFMRYAENGDLLDYIRRHGNIPEHQCKLWFRQMANGLQYLHSNNIAHRDLKCENILITRNWNVKLADFGFSRYSVDEDGLQGLSRTYCGSAAYAAPEIVSGTPYNPKLSDVWSLGIILFIMLNASMPFDDSNLRRLLTAQRNKEFDFRRPVKDRLSQTVKSLVRNILEPDVMERITLDRLLDHEWVKEHEGKLPTETENVSTPCSSCSDTEEDTNNSGIMAQHLISSRTAYSLKPIEEQHSMLSPDENRHAVEVEVD